MFSVDSGDILESFGRIRDFFANVNVVILTSNICTPTVSVIMPAYNAEATIQASIDSVLDQTFPNWELLVIDDGSQDATPLIAKDAADKDPRVRLIANECNMGVAATRNNGIAHAQGQWIAFLDSDDLWHKDKLTKQLAYMSKAGSVVSYTATAYIYEGTNSSFILRAQQELTYRDLLKRNLMSCSSVIVERELVKRYPFPQGNMHEDYAVWLKILKETECAHGINKPLLTYRANRASKSGKLLLSGIMIYHTYRNVGYNSFQSMLLTLRYSLHSIPKRFFVRTGRSRKSQLEG